MGFWKNLREVIYKLDFFYTAELLRYHQQPEYRTIFGGVLSLSIIIVLLVTFYNKVIDTFEKVIITSTLSATNYNNPPLYTLSTKPGQHFMLAVEVWNHDLNQEYRYFDVVLTNVYYDSGQWNDNLTEYIPLEPCTREHWADYPEVMEGFDRLNVNYWQCLPLNREYIIQGKYSSLVSRSVQVAISKCTNSSYFDKPCASPSDIDQLFAQQQNFYYTVYFVNSLINSDSQDYLSYYLEDMNYAIFSASAGEECTLMMEDYTIQTDQSIIPLTDIKEEKGAIITQKCIKNRYSIDPNDPAALYSTIIIFKSPNSITINRSFEKIDEILSYIGGLFGTIAICFFLVNVYNSYSFEIAMGQFLFKPDDDNMRKGLKKYNFLYFLLHLFYMVVSIFKSKCAWKTSKLFYQCRQEMIKQLDISYLFKRVVILERAISTILSRRQIRALHFFDNPTLEEAKKTRRLYKTNHDSLIYRAYHKKNQSISEKERNKNISLLDAKKQDNVPQILSNDAVNGNFGKAFMLSFNTPIKDKAERPDFLAQHSQQSDSESEEDPTDINLKELVALKAEAQKSQISKRIWNQLGQNVKDIVSNSQESYNQQIVLKPQSNSYQFLADEMTQSPIRHNERRSRLKRHRELPTLKHPEGFNVSILQDPDVKESDKQQQSGSYFQMQDLNPIKKQT